MRHSLVVMAFLAIGANSATSVADSDKIDFDPENKIIPVGRTIRPTPEQIQEFFRVVEKREPTVTEFVKTEKFFEQHPLPPPQLLKSRREEADGFFETVLGREPTRKEKREALEFLSEQEKIARRRDELAKETKSQIFGNDASAVLNPGLGSAGLSGDPVLKALELEAALGIGRRPGSPNPDPIAANMAVGSVGGEESSPDPISPGKGHSRSAPAEEVPLNPIVPIPLITTATPLPPVLLSDSLEKALKEKVRAGEISPSEGGRVLKEMLTDLGETGKLPGNMDRTPSEEMLPRTGLVPKGSSKIPNTVPAPSTEFDGIKAAEVLGLSTGLAKGLAAKIQGATDSPSLNSASTEVVASGLSNVLSEFGKTSLSPDLATGIGSSAAANGINPVSGTGGTGTLPSDNSGSNSMRTARSGGTLALPGNEKLNGWLDQFITSYLKKGRGFGGGLAGNRRSASTGPIGLPAGSLTPKEEASVDFTGGAVSLSQAGSELPVSDEQTLPMALWLGFGSLALWTFWILKRRSESDSHDPGKQVEPKLPKLG